MPNAAVLSGAGFKQDEPAKEQPAYLAGTPYQRVSEPMHLLHCCGAAGPSSRAGAGSLHERYTPRSGVSTMTRLIRPIEFLSMTFGTIFVAGLGMMIN
jgi:hypothetical protein